MRGRIYIAILTLCAAVMSCCTRDYVVDGQLDITSIVKFEVSGITPTRVTTDDTWESTDEVGIFMFDSADGSTLSDNVKYGVSSGVGTSVAEFTTTVGSEIIYPNGTSVDFLSYYPYTSSEISDTKILAEAGKDMLVAVAEDLSMGDVVNFDFKHVMAQVSIAITASDEVVDLGGLVDLGVVIKSAYASAIYDMVGEEYSAMSGVQERSFSFTVDVASGGESAQATAILIPYSYSTTVEFTLGDKLYEAQFVSTLESGKCSNYTAVLGSDDVIFSATNIDEWGQGTSGDMGTQLEFENWIDVAAESFDWGTGIESNPYRISDSYQLAKLAADVRDGESYQGVYFQLTDDIELAGAEWTAIGTSECSFEGTLKGSNYWIKGMTITTSDSDGQGLFGYTDGATIDCVGVVDCNVDANYAYIGGMVGYAKSTNISSSFVSGAVSGGPSSVGGLVGYCDGGEISESYTSASVSGNNVSYYVGGAVGYAVGVELYHSYNGGAVTGCSYIGGVAGYLAASNIVASYNSGQVSPHSFAQGSQFYGGLVGVLDTSAIMASYNTADVDSGALVVGDIGGLVGGFIGTNEIKACYSSGASSGQALFGGECTTAVSCYYVGDQGDEGTAVASIEELNSESVIEQLNNQIELWNLYSESQIILYYYQAGSDATTVPPTLTSGVTNIEGVEDWSLMFAPRFAGGEGEQNDPYIISNGYELAKLAMDVKGGQSYEGKYFRLSANIDLMGGEWPPIGGWSYQFRGNFDGADMTVSDFKITGSSSYQGLFGIVDGANIYDLTLSGATISGSAQVAMLVGMAQSQSTITNCHVSGSVSGSADLIGGLVGYLVDSVVEDCSSAGSVTGNSAGWYYVGGLCGYISDSDDVDDTEVVNSYNSASVSGGTYTGGVLGGATDSDNYSHYRGATIYGCYNTGTVTSSSSHTSYAGGVAGRFYDSQMLACYNSGAVNATGYAGGLIGCVHVNATTERMSNFFGCYSRGAVSGTTSSDALFGNAGISGVNIVVDCYYTAGSQTGDYGDICSDINSKVDYLNNGIAYWNYNCARQYNYIYVAGAESPTITSGDADFCFDNWSDVPKLVFAGGAGTEQSPYQISNGYELAKLSADVQAGESYEGVYFEMTQSIDLESIEWSPIGGSSYTFKGNFNGGGNTVSGLKISGSSSNVGLFGCIEGAVVESVKVEGSVSGASKVGALVGQAVAQSVISDCSVDATVSGTSDLVGALIGYLVDSAVVECNSSGAVTGNSAGWYYVGGLCGYACDNDDIDDTYIINSYNAASVNGGTYTGGVMGGATDSDNYSHYRGVTIYGCYNTGTVTSSSSHESYAGGIAGRFYDSQMVACYNTGAVNATGYAGGLIGCVHVNATTTKMSNFFGCYSTSSAISGSTSSDALFGRANVSGVNMVKGCYYTSGTQTGEYGELCSSINDYVDYLNGGIAYWNYNSDQEYPYIYTSATTPPSLISGTAEFDFDAWADVASLSFAGGSGIYSDPYQISNGYELAKLSADVQAGESYEGKYFEITASIDLESKVWSPIGRDGYIFMGNVDGNDKTISNLKVEEFANPVTGGGGSLGLFGYVDGSTISNITLSDYDVLGTICIGGLLGRADLSLITNCHVDGTLHSTSEYGGGVVGYLVDTSMANCSSAGTVYGVSYSGGVVGYAYQRSGVDDIEIYNCSNSAKVSDGKYVGGILGGAADDDTADYVRGISLYCCYNTGKVLSYDATTTYIGGIAGRFHDGQMVACYNLGDVTNTSSVSYAGGLIGCVHPNSTTKTSGFYGCYNGGTISSSLYKEALFGMTHSLEGVVGCYYDSTKQSNESSGLGVAVSGTAGLNGVVDYLSGGIAYWNMISVRDISMVYESGTNGPTLTSGTPELKAENWVDIAALNYAGGSGSEGDPYQISNGSELAKMAVDYNEGIITTSETYFVLTADIDLSGVEWTPIGYSDSKKYSGYFNGQNHTVTGLMIGSESEPYSDSYAGLFGRVSDGSVANIGIINCSIYSNSSFVGAIAGSASRLSSFDTVNITNCYVESGFVKGDSYVGGVVGSARSNIENCRNIGALVHGRHEVGGVVGAANETDIYACYNEANVTAQDSDDYPATYIGGVVGYVEDSCDIVACYNTGHIENYGDSTYDYVAGVAGNIKYDSSNNVVSCYNTGLIKGNYTGGVICCTADYQMLISIDGSYDTKFISLYVDSVYTMNSDLCVDPLNSALTGSFDIGYEFVAGESLIYDPPTLVAKE